MIEFDGPTLSPTHFIIECVLLCFSVFVVVGAICLFFAPLSFFSAEKCIAIGGILLTALLIFGIVALFKWLSVFIHKKCETKKSTQMRNEILIGLSGIVICGIVPRILVFFVKIDGYFVMSSTFLLCAISTALYYLFVYESDKNYASVRIVISKAYEKLIVPHIVVLILTIKLVLICDFNTKTVEKIIFYQIVLWFIGAFVTLDLYGVLSGLRKLKGVDGVEEPGNVRQEPVTVAPKAEQVPSKEHKTYKNQESQTTQTHPKIDCKVCRMEYCETRTPRYLRECGHTICEVCADTLLNINQLLSLRCPFCKIATAVNGPASLLQKNYEVLEIINNLKN